jgi:hypothetical protein
MRASRAEQIGRVGARIDDQVVHATRITGGHEPELARRIAAEQIAVEHAVVHQFAITGTHALAVEIAAGRCFG